ncbi:MAG: adenylate/guanylate cyclase domain-containing protein [Flavobacteriales bacterium]
MKRTLATIIAITSFTSNLSAQRVTVDSLLRVLPTQKKANSERLSTLSGLSWAFGSVMPDSAILFSKEAAELAQRLNDHSMLAGAWSSEAYAQWRKNDVAGSDSLLRMAIELDSARNDEAALARDLINKAVILNQRQLAQPTLDVIRRVRGLTHAGHSADALARMDLLEGIALGMTGKNAEALILLEQAAAAFVRTGNAYAKADALEQLGLAKGNSGRAEDAMRDLEQAMAIYERIGAPAGTMNAHNSMATVFWMAGDFPKATEHYMAALRMAEAQRDTMGQCLFLDNIAKTLLMVEDNATAKEYAEKSLAMAERMGYTSLIGTSLSDLGIALTDLGDLEGAERHLRRYVELMRTGDNRFLLSDAYYQMGELLSQRKKHDEALAMLQKAAEVDRTLNDSWSRASHMMSLGRAISDASPQGLSSAGIAPAQRHAQAMKVLDEALALGRETLQPGIVQSALAKLSDLHEKAGNTQLALTYFRESELIKDSLLTSENSRNVSDLHLKYETEKKEKEILLLGKDKEVQTKEIQKQKLVRNGFIGGFALVLAFAGVFLFQRNRISKEKKRSEELLLNILPEEVAEELKNTGAAAAKHFDNATILFTDFKGFTEASEKLSPQELVEELNTCFKAFDHIITARGIEKIKTIGDAYMCAGGLPDPKTSSPADVVHAALEMQAFMTSRKLERDAKGLPAFEMRVGIHTGPVVAGIVGVKKFQYDIWGDTVNTASRMESSGEVGQVNISEATYALVREQASGLFDFTPRGKVQAKGKGEMEMYFVDQAGTQLDTAPAT